VRRSAHQDDLEHRERELNATVLRYERNPLRDGGTGELAQISIIKKDLTAKGEEYPVEQAEEGGLSRTIRPEKAQEFTPVHGE
jgi:hypothetical protein